MDAMQIIISVGGFLIVVLTGVVWAFLINKIASASRKADLFKKELNGSLVEMKADLKNELRKMEDHINKLYEENKNIRESMRQEQQHDMQRREAFGSRMFTEIKNLSEKWETKIDDLVEKVNDLEVTTSGMQSTYLTRTEYDQRRKKPDTVIITRDGSSKS